MLLTPHLLTGAVIASKILNPLLALPLAYLSHYLLDLPPQTEYSIKNIREKRWNRSFLDFSKVFLDISLGISLISLLSKGSPVIFAAALLAIIPDSMTLLHILFPNNKLLVRHQRFHIAVNDVCDSEDKKIPAFWGILSQVVVIITAIYLL